MENNLGRIYDLVNNKSLSKHQLIINLYKLSVNELPKLPPAICTCRITLNNGKQYDAILEYKMPPYFYKDEDDKDEFFWKVLSRNPRKRHNFKLADVKTWQFV